MPSPRARRALVRHHAVPAAVLVVGVASAAIASVYFRNVARDQAEARFRDVAAQTTAQITERMEAYAVMLRAGRGFFDALGSEPDPESFRRFVDSLEVRTLYPGIQGIGWSKLLRPGEVAAHVGARRAAGFPSYHVWPEGRRDVYSSIVMLEPLDWRNERAIGYDMFSEPTRRAAMERARDTNSVAASGKVELVQETDTERQAGFLVYAPVYSREPTSLSERRATLRGWIYAPFRAADLVHGALGVGPAHALGLSVWDGGEQRREALLYESGVPERDVVWTVVHRKEIAGRPWTFRYGATRAFTSTAERTLPGGAFAGGLAVTLLLFWVTRGEVRARARAEAAARRTSFLADAGQALSSSLDYAATLPRVAQLAVERIADACIVSIRGEGAPLRAAAHHDAARTAQLLGAVEELAIDPDALLGAARGEDDPERPHTQPRLGARTDLVDEAPQLAALLRQLGLRAALTVPLAARGEGLGGIVLLAEGPPFGAEDEALASDLARIVSAAVDTSRLYAQARDAVRQRDEFLSVASHELRTPLTSLALQSESLRAKALRTGASDVASKTEVIRRNVDRLTRLVAALLDLSRITAGRLEVELEEVDLAELTREVVSRFEDEARRTGCALVLDAPGPVTGQWDRMRVDQIVTNLVSNAIKYGPGAPVEVRVQATSDRATVAVRDHGIGIGPEDQKRIFGRFERAVSKRHYGGFGLGLWIVREIVERLGGTVRVDSAPGKGSTFTVELARGAAARAEPGAVARARGPRSA